MGLRRGLQVVKVEEGDEEDEENEEDERRREAGATRVQGLHSCEIYDDRRFVETTMSDNYLSGQNDVTKQFMYHTY
jgi:hypothetical protein